MITLSYGYQKPQTGDRGSPLFLALEANIQKLNDHTHDGTNSAPLPAQSIIAVTQNISSSNWVTYGGPAGHYRQLVTMPAGFSYNSVQIGHRLTSGHVIFPTVEKVSATQYYLYTNDNSIDMVAIYGG